MTRLHWFKWVLYFLITILALEALKAVISKIQGSPVYLITIVLIAFETLAVLAFFYYALFITLLGKKMSKKRLLLYCSMSFICLIALLELLFSYWLYHPSKIPEGLQWAYKYYYDTYHFRMLQFEDKLTVYDKGLLYTLKPGAKAGFDNAEFSTTVSVNSLGLRDNEEALKAPEIICLGDSFTMGWGIDEPQTFAKNIEQTTGRKVLNAGIPSYGTARELALLDRLDVSALKYIVIQYCSNDLSENNSFIANNYTLKLTPYPEYMAARKSYRLSRKYFPGKNFLLVSQLWLKKEINKLFPVFKFSTLPFEQEFKSEEHAAAFLKVLLKYREKLKNVKVIVTSIDISRYRNNRFLEELARQISHNDEASQMKNIFISNTATELTDSDYFILDYHIRPEGQKKIAGKLLEQIK